MVRSAANTIAIWRTRRELRKPVWDAEMAREIRRRWVDLTDEQIAAVVLLYWETRAC